MDRRIDPTLRTTIASLLAPTEGLEPDRFFSTPPIEALESLKELGSITKGVFQPFETPSSTEASPNPSSEGETSPPPAADSENRLVESLLEYHRLRNPMLGVKAGPAYTPADRTQPPTERGFSSMEIPVVQDYVPKTSSHPYRSGEATRSVLKSKRDPTNGSGI